MATLYIANIRGDYAAEVRTATGLAAHSRLGSDTCARFVWHLNEGDVLLTPDGPKDGFVEYVAERLQLSPQRLNVVTTHGLLDDESLLSSEVVERLRQYVTTSDWVIEAFLLTPGVVALADLLGIPRPAGDLFALQGGVSYINLKSSFRSYAQRVGIPIPVGTTVKSPTELADAMVGMGEASDALILKHERGGGGRGNIGLVRVEGQGLSGTRETRVIPSNPWDLAMELWGELVEDKNPALTVEQYIRDGQPFYSEWRVGDTQIDLVSTGAIRYSARNCPNLTSPSWTGLVLPHMFGGHTASSTLLQAFIFIQHIQSLGYRGFVNIDGLVDPLGKIFFHEINARWGGGLVAATVASRLLGIGWANNSCVSTVLDLPTTTLENAVGVLNKDGLGYNPITREGVVVLSLDSDLGNGAEYMIIAGGYERLSDFELRLRESVLQVSAHADAPELDQG
ncbi:hypothetical protein [Rathayibacter rathayi]|uniref:preATP grasp domain-containing protein n=1 Tax=Rathayibacter rathayi TaxID=33887 RepID=UPI0015E22B1C|nr:hypothetical protein [Rathayibacter rathayi]